MSYLSKEQRGMRARLNDNIPRIIKERGPLTNQELTALLIEEKIIPKGGGFEMNCYKVHNHVTRMIQDGLLKRNRAVKPATICAA